MNEMDNKVLTVYIEQLKDYVKKLYLMNSALHSYLESNGIEIDSDDDRLKAFMKEENDKITKDDDWNDIVGYYDEDVPEELYFGDGVYGHYDEDKNLIITSDEEYD